MPSVMRGLLSLTRYRQKPKVFAVSTDEMWAAGASELAGVETKPTNLPDGISIRLSPGVQRVDRNDGDSSVQGS